MYVYMYVCIYVCMYAYIYIYIYIHMCNVFINNLERVPLAFGCLPIICPGCVSCVSCIPGVPASIHERTRRDADRDLKG